MFTPLNVSSPVQDEAITNEKCSDMVTTVPGRVSEIRHDDPRRLLQNVSELEKELFEYQHNMGLLLIEKKEWSSKYEELQQEFEDVNECLKREEDLRKALGIEKQCALDLKKALRELRSENSEIKFTADSKLTEANALVRSVEEKSLEVEAKLRAVDEKLAEVSRKSSEVERKSKEVEAREADEATLSKQREDLREWERKLQEGEERVAKAQMIVKQREDRANESDKIFKQKGKELEEAEKKIDAANIALKRSQTELKEQIEKCRSKQELLLKEAEDLKAQRETFEKEREELDERKAEIDNERKNITSQKEKLERHNHLEEERLEKEKQAANENMKRELEALEVEKASFAETMEHERSMISKKADSERSQLLHDIEMHKRKLELDMQTKLEERERVLQAKAKLFEEERERELSNINYLRDLARREMADMLNERQRIEKEKLEVENQQTEIRKEFNDLVALTKKLKELREQFISETNRFLSSMESNKNCNPCGELLSDFVLPDIDNMEIPNLQKPSNILDNEALRKEMGDVTPTASALELPAPGGTVSWLRKCTSKILKLSPIKMTDTSATRNLADQVPQTTEQADVNIDPSTMFQAATNCSIDVHKAESETCPREVEVANINLDSDQSNINNSKAEEVAAELLSNINTDGQSRRRRKRSVKDVEDAKAFYGKSIEFNEPVDSTGNGEDPAKGNDGGVGKPQGRSTCTTEHDVDESDEKSDSVTEGVRQRGKRRQRVASEQQGEVVGQRYNLRRPRRGAGETAVDKVNEETDEGIHCTQTTATVSVGAAVREIGVRTNLVQSEAMADAQETDDESSKRRGTLDFLDDVAR